MNSMNSMSLVSSHSYPDFIAEKLERIKQRGGVQTFVHSRYTYVLLATGERPTGGYHIQGLKAEKVSSAKGDYIQITAKEIRPEPGTVLIQALTYPTAVYRIPKTNLPVKVKWVRT